MYNNRQVSIVKRPSRVLITPSLHNVEFVIRLNPYCSRGTSVISYQVRPIKFLVDNGPKDKNDVRIKAWNPSQEPPPPQKGLKEDPLPKTLSTKRDAPPYPSCFWVVEDQRSSNAHRRRPRNPISKTILNWPYNTAHNRNCHSNEYLKTNCYRAVV
ncbi:Uncharacterized protein HZ326_3206 [Fusarium oxysporum f. sp. albedinis]|nr:Uncharacterized protein HZ326_3206 [Fusarium oxysporum f. sp. albedinis]